MEVNIIITGVAVKKKKGKSGKDLIIFEGLVI